MKPVIFHEIDYLSKNILISDPGVPNLLLDLEASAPSCAFYLRFLYEFAKKYEPSFMLETGTDRGRSAAHLALGNPKGMVYTVDIDPACARNVNELLIDNISASTEDSLIAGKDLPPIVELLFIDSEHTYEHAKAEWELFRPKIVKGGIAFFDDIALNDGMKRFWQEISEPKLDLSHLHYSGFGAAFL